MAIVLVSSLLLAAEKCAFVIVKIMLDITSARAFDLQLNNCNYRVSVMIL